MVVVNVLMLCVCLLGVCYNVVDVHMIRFDVIWLCVLNDVYCVTHIECLTHGAWVLHWFVLCYDCQCVNICYYIIC